MSDETKKLEDSDQELLVSYLDGELEGQDARLVEDRLTADHQFRDQLQALERSWDLLDDLPVSEVGENFTQTTIGIVAQKATVDLQSATDDLRKTNLYKWCGILAAALITAAIGFWGFGYWLDRDNRNLVNDLLIIERVDMYRNVEDLDFLKSLANDDLFGGEEEDEQLR